LLILGWVAAGPILAYFPIAVQRRLLEGIFVPLCALAVHGLYLWWVGLRRRLRHKSPVRTLLAWRWVVLIILCLTLPTTSLFMLIEAINAGHRTDPKLFHPAGEIAMLDWLNVHAQANSIVLCDFDTGNYVPVRTDLRVFIGHSPETLYLDEKQPIADKFYAGQMNDSEQDVFFAKYAIRYVLFSPEQQTQAVMKSLSPSLRLLPYNNGDGYRIYEVPTPHGS
jgi:hypothetical protein